MWKSYPQTVCKTQAMLFGPTRMWINYDMPAKEAKSYGGTFAQFRQVVHIFEQFIHFFLCLVAFLREKSFAEAFFHIVNSVDNVEKLSTENVDNCLTPQ
jgi:hypothetical protein